MALLSAGSHGLTVLSQQSWINGLQPVTTPESDQIFPLQRKKCTAACKPPLKKASPKNTEASAKTEALCMEN